VGIRLKNIDVFYSHLEYFMYIRVIVSPFGTFSVHLVPFSGFGYHVPRKIWQPCAPPKKGGFDAGFRVPCRFPDSDTCKIDSPREIFLRQNGKVRVSRKRVGRRKCKTPHERGSKFSAAVKQEFE
jgi:hypothetical protein